MQGSQKAQSVLCAFGVMENILVYGTNDRDSSSLRHTIFCSHSSIG